MSSKCDSTCTARVHPTPHPTPRRPSRPVPKKFTAVGVEVTNTYYRTLNRIYILSDDLPYVTQCWRCLNSDGWMSVSSRSLFSFSGQSTWDSWWAGWQGDRGFSEYFCFPLSVLPSQCLFIYLPSTLYIATETLVK